jgi:hypothetical protein
MTTASATSGLRRSSTHRYRRRLASCARRAAVKRQHESSHISLVVRTCTGAMPCSVTAASSAHTLCLLACAVCMHRVPRGTLLTASISPITREWPGSPAQPGCACTQPQAPPARSWRRACARCSAWPRLRRCRGPAGPSPRTTPLLAPLPPLISLPLQHQAKGMLEQHCTDALQHHLCGAFVKRCMHPQSSRQVPAMPDASASRPC